MKTPAERFATALAIFQDEANAVFAEAADFAAAQYDTGLELGTLVRRHHDKS